MVTSPKKSRGKQEPKGKLRRVLNHTKKKKKKKMGETGGENLEGGMGGGSRLSPHTGKKSAEPQQRQATKKIR